MESNKHTNQSLLMSVLKPERALRHWKWSTVGYATVGRVDPIRPGQDNDGHASDDAVHGSAHHPLRKRSPAWSQEEHSLFLLGLERLGKGDWKGISRTYVKTRTPTQVASHAQKYFLRSTRLKRRRSTDSLVEITPNTTAAYAEWIFILISLCLEILSLAFDQASSPSRPYCALFGMLLGIGALFVSICELIYKGRKEKVELRRWGMLWWFYYPSPPRSRRLYGTTLLEMYGLLGGVSQCICSTVQYVFFIRHDQSPIKVSLLPAIFLVCLAASRLGGKSKAPCT